MKVAALFAAFALFAGCGGATPTLEGNWDLRMTSSRGLSFPQTHNLSGVMDQRDGRLQASFVSSPTAPCSDFTFVFLEGQLTGRVASFTGRLAAQDTDTIKVRGFFDPKTDTFQGDYSAVTPQGCIEEGSIVGTRFDKLAGEWTGTLTGVGDPAITANVSLTVTQSDSQNGGALLTGNITYAGSDCFASGPVTGGVSGAHVSIESGDLDTVFTSFFGTLQDSRQMTVQYLATRGPCQGTWALGTMHKR